MFGLLCLQVALCLFIDFDERVDVNCEAKTPPVCVRLCVADNMYVCPLC